jgi:hypothetical protein
MKTMATWVSVAAFLVAIPCLADDDNGSHRGHGPHWDDGPHWGKCKPTGTWIGGKTDVGHGQYIYTFTPSQGNTSIAKVDNTTGPAAYDVDVTTPWSGQLKKTGKFTYELRIVELERENDVRPSYEYPVIYAAKANVAMLGCDTIELYYDWVARYDDWGDKPFVDEPSAFLRTSANPGYELINRVEVDFEPLPQPQ